MCIGFVPLMFADLRLRIDGEVTVTDASSTGGGMCISKGLTTAGEAAARATSRREAHPAADEFLLVSAFDGIGGARRSWDHLALPVGCHLSFEINPHAKRVVSARWPDSIAMGDITKVTAQKLIAHRQSVRNPKKGLLAGGWPCVDMSVLNEDGKGLAGKNAQLVWSLLRLWCLLREVFDSTEWEFMYENVMSDKLSDIAVINEAVGVLPVLIDSADHCWSRRPRLYWVSWQLPSQLLQLEDEGVYRRARLISPPGEPSVWLDRGSRWLAGELDSEARLPTFVRHLPRKSPPKVPAGLERCDEVTLKRWSDDSYAMAPYQYADRNTILRWNGKVTTPSARERELLLGFEADHTAVALKSSFLKDQKRQSESIRLGLLGNSWNTYTTGWLLNHLAVDLHYVNKVFTPDELRRGLPALKPEAELADLPGYRSLTLGEQLVLRFLQGVDHRGSDVRLDTGQLFRPNCWPRDSLRVELWMWREVVSYPWKYAAHINELEARGALQALRWRLRRVRGIGRRYLHLLDSIVSLSVLSKRRSSSYVLNRVVKRYDALELASSSAGAFGFVRSDKNPSDRASRRW